MCARATPGMFIAAALADAQPAAFLPVGTADTTVP